MPNRAIPKKFSSSRSQKYYSNFLETAFESSARKMQPLSKLRSSAYPSLAVHRKKGKSKNSRVFDQQFLAPEETCREFVPKVTFTSMLLRRIQSIEHEHQEFRSHDGAHHVREFGPKLASKTKRSQDVVAGRHDNSLNVVSINKVTNWLQKPRDDEMIAEIAEVVANVCFIEPKLFELIESDAATNNSTLKEIFNCNSPGEISQIIENDLKPYESTNIVRSSPAFNDRILMDSPSTPFIPPSRNIHYRDADNYRRPLIPPSFQPYITDTPETKLRMHSPKSADITLDTTVENILGLANTLEKDATTNVLNQSVVEWTDKRFPRNELDTSIDEFWKDFAKLKVNTTFDSNSTDSLRKAENFDLVETLRQRNGGIFNNSSPESTLNHQQKFMQEIDNSVQRLENGFQPIGRKHLSKRHQQPMFRSNYDQKHHEMKFFVENSFLHQTLATDMILEPQNSYMPEVLLDNRHIDKIIRSLERDMYVSKASK